MRYCLQNDDKGKGLYVINKNEIFPKIFFLFKFGWLNLQMWKFDYITEKSETINFENAHENSIHWILYLSINTFILSFFNDR